MIPVTATAKFILPLQQVDVYGLLGTGLYFGTFKANVSGFGSASDSSTALGLHAGAGVMVPVAPRLLVGGEFRYHIANMTFSDTKLGVDSVQISAGLSYRL